jgi:hypothetical protein
VTEVTLPKSRSHNPKQSSNSNASENNISKPFSYSVSYLTWGLSDREDDDIERITLPLKKMSLEKSGSKQSKHKMVKKSGIPI